MEACPGRVPGWGHGKRVPAGQDLRDLRQETGPCPAHTPVSAFLGPLASLKQMPMFTWVRGTQAPPPLRKATGAGASSGLQKAPADPGPSSEAALGTVTPPCTRWVAGESRPCSGPWLLPWPVPSTQVRLMLVAPPRPGAALVLEAAGSSEACVGLPAQCWSRSRSWHLGPYPWL